MSDVAPRLVVLGSTLTALAVVRNATALGMRPLVFDTAAGIATTTRCARIEAHAGMAPDEVVNRLVTAGARETAWLVATSDAWLRFIVTHRATLERSFARILHPGNDVLAICLGKKRFGDWCREHGLPVPKEFPVEPLATARRGDLPFPLLLRPRASVHGAARRVPKALEVTQAAELERALALYAEAGIVPLVTESLLPRSLQQYSVGASRRGGDMISFVARKCRPLPRECAVGTYVELDPQLEVEALARKTLEALDYQGIAEVEILRDASSGELFLVEINARPWVQYALAAASGHDLLAFQLRPGGFDHARARQRGLRWVNLTEDLYVCFSRTAGMVRRGELTAADYARSLRRANVYAHFSWRDPGPALRALREFLFRRR